MTITTVRSEADIQGILTLQRANLRQNVSADVQANQGFVTVQHDPAVLTRMNRAAPSVIAKDGETVVGYCLTMLPAFAVDIPQLTSLFAAINVLTYAGRPVRDYPYYVMGQVCVADGYRGQQLFDRMYQHHRDTYGDRYQLLITDISENNPRSLRAHARVGFEPLHSFRHAKLNETWVIVGWDWQK